MRVLFYLDLVECIIIQIARPSTCWILAITYDRLLQTWYICVVIHIRGDYRNTSGVIKLFSCLHTYCALGGQIRANKMWFDMRGNRLLAVCLHSSEPRRSRNYVCECKNGETGTDVYIIQAAASGVVPIGELIRSKAAVFPAFYVHLDILDMQHASELCR